MFHDLLGRVCAGEDLSQEQTAAALNWVMEGRAAQGEIALLLMGLRIKGETPAEVAGAALAMRQHLTPIRHAHPAVVDTCGTGGGGSRLFNVSTAAALVTAAAGLPVAKHGNRKITSRSGSADALAALGVNIEADVPTVEGCLADVGICFCFAPLLHSAMRYVAPVRRQLGVGTIFNLLGPLTNPAGAPFQLLGTPRNELRPLLAGALLRLGTQRAAVVSGSDGLGEVTLAGPTHVTLVEQGALHETQWQPSDFGLTAQSVESLQIEAPEQSAALIRSVLAGEQGPARDLVVLNAAAALWIGGKADNLRSAAELAAGAIDRGSAAQTLERLVARSHGQSLEAGGAPR